jgi:hypothetical protein
LIARLINPDGGKMVFDGDGVAEYGGIALKSPQKPTNGFPESLLHSIRVRRLSKPLPMVLLCTPYQMLKLLPKPERYCNGLDLHLNSLLHVIHTNSQAGSVNV